MTDPLPPELANLPKPELIEETDVEQLFATALADFKARLVAAGIPVDTLGLANEPGALVLQSTSGEALRLRQRLNEVYRGGLLAFARAGGLEHLAAWSHVFRLTGEMDAALRNRVVVANQTRESAGTDPRYRHIALGVDPRVKDAAVYTEGKDPRVHIAVVSTDNGGVADQVLLDKVAAAINHRSRRTLNDTIVVEPAVTHTVTIAAQLWLEPDAPATVIDGLPALVRAAWSPILGRDFTRDWLTARLMQHGVHRLDITSPAANVAILPRQAATIGTITLTIAGRDF